MFTTDSGRTIKETVEESSSGETAPFTKATGKITWPLDMEDLSMLMETYMWENGLTIEPQEKVKH